MRKWSEAECGICEHNLDEYCVVNVVEPQEHLQLPLAERLPLLHSHECCAEQPEVQTKSPCLKPILCRKLLLIALSTCVGFSLIFVALLKVPRVFSHLQCIRGNIPQGVCIPIIEPAGGAEATDGSSVVPILGFGVNRVLIRIE